MKSPNELQSLLDDVVHSLSEYTDKEIVTLHDLLERSYVHVLLEASLRHAEQTAAPRLTAVSPE